MGLSVLVNFCWDCPYKMDLEEEIRLELERLEQILDGSSCMDDSANFSAVKPNRVSYSAYEYAEAEGEKEELEDKLNLLLSKTEDFSLQMDRMNNLNVDLQNKCKEFQNENARLKGIIESRSVNKSPEVQRELENTVIDHESLQVCSSIGPSASSIALEHLLVEERAKVTQLESKLRDMVLIKESVLLELERERGMRIHAGTLTSLNFCFP